MGKRGRMIINIPLQIDEKAIEDCLNVDYEKKVEEYLFKEVEQALLKRSGFYDTSATRGMEQIVRDAVDRYIQEWKDTIIEQASERLIDRLARTKKAKEMANEL